MSARNSSDMPGDMPRDDRLDRLYRDAAQAEPSPALDRAILAAATEAVRPPAPRRRPSGWRRWLPATTAIAATAIGVSVGWRVFDESERAQRAESAASEVAAPAAPAAPPAAAPPAEKTKAESAVTVAPAAKRASPELAKPAPAVPVGVPAAADAAAPASVGRLEASGKEMQEASRDRIVPLRQAPAAAAAMPGEARRDAAPLEPESWLRQVRELLAAGRSEDARDSLRRFRVRYPDYPLPADLAALVKD